MLQSNGKQFEKEIMAYLTTAKAREEAGSGVASQMSQPIIGSQASAAGAVIVAGGAAGAGSNANRQMGYNRFDQERYAAKDETGGFSIDTKLTYQPNGGALSLAPTTGGSGGGGGPPTPTDNVRSSSTSNPIAATAPSATSTQLATQKANVMPPSSSSSTAVANPKAKLVPSPNQPVKRTHVTPIIIVPNTNTSIITLFNCLDILQDLK